MSHTERTFIVSCGHAIAKYNRTNVSVTARQDGFDGRWYVSMCDFGCSKSYRTPEDAIYGMLQEHGCKHIRVNPATAA